MKTKKIITLVLSLIVLFGIVIFVFKDDKNIVKEETNIVKPELNKLLFSSFDLNNYDDSATLINLSDINEDTLELSSGTYKLKGSFKGTIYIRAGDEKVHLLFDGIEVNSKSGPAIVCENADKLVITLMEGTNNNLSDSAYYDPQKEYSACIDSNVSVTINGLGKLDILGLHKDAIHTKDILKVISAEINTKCKRTSFKANDGIRIDSAKMFIESEKNGLYTSKSEMNDNGYIVIENSDISIISGEISFISKSDLYILNSNINERSIVSLYEVGGTAYIQEGSIK